MAKAKDIKVIITATVNYSIPLSTQEAAYLWGLLWGITHDELGEDERKLVEGILDKLKVATKDSP